MQPAVVCLQHCFQSPPPPPVLSSHIHASGLRSSSGPPARHLHLSTELLRLDPCRPGLSVTIATGRGSGQSCLHLEPRCHTSPPSCSSQTCPGHLQHASPVMLSDQTFSRTLPGVSSGPSSSSSSRDKRLSCCESRHCCSLLLSHCRKASVYISDRRC